MAITKHLIRFSKVKQFECLDLVPLPAGEILQDVTNTLKEGICVFFFTKTDGSIRKAIGTLNPQIIEHYLGKPNTSKEKEESLEEKPNLIYYDLEKKRFGSFVKSNLIAIV